MEITLIASLPIGHIFDALWYSAISKYGVFKEPYEKSICILAWQAEVLGKKTVQ